MFHLYLKTVAAEDPFPINCSVFVLNLFLQKLSEWNSHILSIVAGISNHFTHLQTYATDEGGETTLLQPGLILLAGSCC